MECITIKNLRFHAGHGYFPAEREKGNDFEVDITIWLELEAAATGDDLAATIDYGEAAEIAGGYHERRTGQTGGDTAVPDRRIADTRLSESRKYRGRRQEAESPPWSPPVNSQK